MGEDLHVKYSRGLPLLDRKNKVADNPAKFPHLASNYTRLLLVPGYLLTGPAANRVEMEAIHVINHNVLWR